MLEVKQLEGGYGKAQVLFQVDLEIQQGQAVSMVGRNGMGKSTIIQCIMGLLPVQGGAICFRGQEISKLRPFQIAQRGIALVPEGRRVFKSLTVEENLIATSRGNNAPKAWTLDRVMDLFPRLRERRQQSASTLSGGEQQMLAIGRALMINPSLLILDEATEGLAPLIRQEIWETLAQLKKEGMTILVVDKNLKEMGFLLDKHYIIEKGRVVWQGTVSELEQQETIRSRYLGV
jgi:branched-chain amino acid transport system ATP-binding protein